jgi:hypothetical protein
MESVINRAASEGLAIVNAEQMLLLPRLFLQALFESRWLKSRSFLLKMGTVRSFEALVHAYQTTRRHIT